MESKEQKLRDRYLHNEKGDNEDDGNAEVDKRFSHPASPQSRGGLARSIVASHGRAVALCGALSKQESIEHPADQRGAGHNDEAEDQKLGKIAGPQKLYETHGPRSGLRAAFAQWLAIVLVHAAQGLKNPAFPRCVGQDHEDRATNKVRNQHLGKTHQPGRFYAVALGFVLLFTNVVSIAHAWPSVGIAASEQIRDGFDVSNDACMRSVDVIEVIKNASFTSLACGEFIDCASRDLDSEQFQMPSLKRERVCSSADKSEFVRENHTSRSFEIADMNSVAIFLRFVEMHRFGILERYGNISSCGNRVPQIVNIKIETPFDRTFIRDCNRVDVHLFDVNPSSIALGSCFSLPASLPESCGGRSKSATRYNHGPKRILAGFPPVFLFIFPVLLLFGIGAFVRDSDDQRTSPKWLFDFALWGSFLGAVGTGFWLTQFFK